MVACVFLALLLCFLASCGNNGGGPEITAAELTADGWGKFESGQFEEALHRFGQAIEKDPDYGEAYNGVGWCCVRLDSLRSGLDAFNQAMAKGVISGDPRAGLAVICRDLDPVDFQMAISWAESALATDSDYVFSHDTLLNWRDLRLIIAQSCYGLGLYDDAHAQVDILDPDNALDPASSTYIEELLAEIQRLGAGI
jgi:tetratricopeptide (TPR) repeat protein